MSRQPPRSGQIGTAGPTHKERPARFRELRPELGEHWRRPDDPSHRVGAALPAQNAEQQGLSLAPPAYPTQETQPRPPPAPATIATVGPRRFRPISLSCHRQAGGGTLPTPVKHWRGSVRPVDIERWNPRLRYCDHVAMIAQYERVPDPNLRRF
jgi:hypothetical protein